MIFSFFVFLLDNFNDATVFPGHAFYTVQILWD